MAKKDIAGETTLHFRVSDITLKELRAIAVAYFGGNTSMALRALVERSITHYYADFVAVAPQTDSELDAE